MIDLKKIGVFISDAGWFFKALISLEFFSFIVFVMLILLSGELLFLLKYVSMLFSFIVFISSILLWVSLGYHLSCKGYVKKDLVLLGCVLGFILGLVSLTLSFIQVCIASIIIYKKIIFRTIIILIPLSGLIKGAFLTSLGRVIWIFSAKKS